MTHENIPTSAQQQDATTVQDAEEVIAEEQEVSEEIQEATEGKTHPTSSDVGKQTLTQADLGYDVTKEGVPPDEEALATSQHPDDPSAHEESEYNQ